MITDDIKRCLHSVKHTFHALMEEYNDGLTAKQIEDALKDGFELIEDYPKRKKMSKKSRNIVDGLGADRVVDINLNELDGDRNRGK